MTTTKLLTTVLLLFAVLTAGAQTDSKGFRFQGFAETPEGDPLKSEEVTIRFTVYPKTGTGFIFIETQEQKTDNFGVFYANVGEMNPDDIQKINFAADYWMKVEVKKTSGGVYSTISDTELTATPYARHAANGVPVGTIMAFGGELDKIPEGWLLCNGIEYDGGDPLYEQLYNVIGSNWGGSGMAFNVPELSGNFMRGVDKGEGNDPDAASRIAIQLGGNTSDKVGSYQEGELQEHSHSASLSTAGNHSHSWSKGNCSTDEGGDSGNNIIKSGHSQGSFTVSVNTTGSHTHTVALNNTGEAETRPIHVYVAYIIKF